MSSNTYQPSDIQAGGARISTSMLSVWAKCRSEWFYTYLAPHPSGEPSTAGLLTGSSEAADLGKDIHSALEVYRLSGWRDGTDTGDYSLDAAVAQFDALWEAREDQVPLEKWEELRAQAHFVLKGYHTERPSSLTDWRLMADAQGLPMVEKEYAIPILGGRFLYTVKTDAVGQRTRPAHVVRAIDYKTKSYRYLNEFIRATPLLGQGWGEVAVLHVFFPDLPIDGMQFEVLVKDRGKSSSLPIVEVAEVGVTPRQAARWLTNVERWALEIAWSVAEWNTRVARGDDPYQAGMEVFPSSGQLAESGTCARYGRVCDFARVCEMYDESGAQGVLMDMEARSTLVEETTQ